MHELAWAVTLSRVQAVTTSTEWPPRVSVLARGLPTCQVMG